MSENLKILIFEDLTLGNLPYAFIGRLLGFNVFYLSIHPTLLNHPWFKRLQNFLRAKKYVDKQSTYHEKIQAHVKAVEQIDRIYKQNFSHKALIRKVTQKTGESADFSYKKVLLEIVTSYHTNRVTLLQLQKENSDAHISFVPVYFLKVQGWIRKSGWQEESLKNITISGFSRVYQFFLSAFNRLKWLGIFLAFPLWIFLKIRHINFKTSKVREDYQLGLRVYKNDWAFFSKQRSIDFLMDGTSLNKDNTIFCVETRISDGYKEELRNRGYKIVYIQDILNSVDVHFLREVLIKDFMGLWASLLVRALTVPAVILESTLKNLQTYVLWKRFINQYHLEHYVVYNDFDNRHVIRNMLLAEDKTKTWFYQHSRHHSDLFAPVQVKEKYCHAFYSFLIYDNMVVWSNNIEAMMRPNRIKRFLGLGSLWSEHIKEIEAKTDFNDLRQKYEQKFKGKIRKMIGVFDTTFGDNVILNSDSMIVFARAILGLLNDFPDVAVVFKEKNSREDIENAAGLFEFYDQLQRHERCLFVGSVAETSEVIAVCDLSLSICFTSPTVEALGARKRAIYFDPTSNFVGTYYDNFPKLVAHNYEELRQLVQYWLDEVSDDDFNRWIDQYIVGEVDTFADGQAITRMRHELIKRNGKR